MKDLQILFPAIEAGGVMLLLRRREHLDLVQFRGSLDDGRMDSSQDLPNRIRGRGDRFHKLP